MILGFIWGFQRIQNCPHLFNGHSPNPYRLNLAAWISTSNSNLLLNKHHSIFPHYFPSIQNWIPIFVISFISSLFRWWMMMTVIGFGCRKASSDRPKSMFHCLFVEFEFGPKPANRLVPNLFLVRPAHISPTLTFYWLYP